MHKEQDSSITVSGKPKRSFRVSRGLFRIPESIECDDDVDGSRKGLFGASVVGEQDTPGFEISDGAFDDGANVVDLLVEFFFPVEEVAVCGFFGGG